jgi:hypothetical protein
MTKVQNQKGWWIRNEKKIFIFLTLNFIIPALLFVVTDNEIVRNYLIAFGIGLPWLIVIGIEGYHQKSEPNIEDEIIQEKKNFNDFLKDREHNDKHRIAQIEKIRQLQNKLENVRSLNEMSTILQRVFKMLTLLFAMLFFIGDSLDGISNFLLSIGREETDKTELEKTNEVIRVLELQLKQTNTKFEIIEKDISSVKAENKKLKSKVNDINNISIRINKGPKEEY